MAGGEDSATGLALQRVSSASCKRGYLGRFRGDDISACGIERREADRARDTCNISGGAAWP